MRPVTAAERSPRRNPCQYDGFFSLLTELFVNFVPHSVCLQTGGVFLLSYEVKIEVMKSLVATLTEMFGEAFVAQGLDRTYGEVVVSQRPDLGHFQCNGALPAAREAKQNPRAVAQAVLDAVQPRHIFADLSLAGPGFINITLTDEFLAERIEAVAHDERLGCPAVEHPRNVVIDFGGPNVAKAMHVGHLRSSIIGDSLQRVFRFMGENVTSDVHLGDWGTQMGMLITELQRRNPELPYFDASYTGPYPEESPISIEDLEAMYPQASALAKSDEAAAEAARLATAELQQGRPGYRALWQHFATISKTALQRDFASLGVYFDLWLGESDTQERIPSMITRLEQGGFLEESDGARIIRLSEGEEDKNVLPPLLIVKTDGGVMYGTTDLATIEQRVEDLHANLILYVVDARQSLHFRQVFEAAKRTGIAGTTELEHIGFGTMNGADGKPFKTRAGGVMKLQDLLQMGRDEALKRMDEQDIAKDYPDEERLDIAHKVGIAAVKYADLMNHRTSDYIFDLEKFTRFEGRTGAYLLYAAVRIKSILRKAQERGIAPGTIVIGAPEERDLILLVQQLPEIVEATWRNRAPNHLSDYVFTLAQVFSRFYQNCPILREEKVEVQASRLALAALCLRTFEQVLYLLGIEIPERM